MFAAVAATDRSERDDNEEEGEGGADAHWWFLRRLHRCGLRTRTRTGSLTGG